VEPTFTPGAWRVCRLASGIARGFQAEKIEPAHLLWALVFDESHAAVILADRGLSPEELARRLAPAPEPPIGDAERLGAVERPLPLLPRSELLETVVIEASRLVGRYREVGTEHLLCGLATIESPVQCLLLEYGISPADAQLRLLDFGGIASGPLPGKFHLEPSGPPLGENNDLYRILDAAANRAREGLRVLEDYVRFTADDPHLTRLVKTERHRLAEALRLLDQHGLISSRDTRRDVGTTVHTARERSRESLIDVVRASCKRVQEASRTLEEYGKIVSLEFAALAAELRYASYTIEKAILTTFESRARLEDRRLYLLATHELCPHGAGPVIRAALDAGVGIVQVREENFPDRELVVWGRYVRDWTAAAGALYIMNDRPDLAVLTGADGVHVGQDELTVRDARRIVGPDKLVGVSTHTLDQARTAVLDGADYIGVGPVFPSATKSFGTCAGLEFVRQVAAEITLPAFAIGGIDAENIGDVIAAGASRVAVSGAVCRAADPREAVRELLGRMRPEQPGRGEDDDRSPSSDE
jgi:thiamine-phosphate pyrophosphorylase